MSRHKTTHRCTRVENPGGGGYLKFLPKSLGGSRVSGKIAWGGGPPILGFPFIAFLFTSFFENLPEGGAVSYPPQPPLPSPVCIYETTQIK
jgi:hypothetical protein